LTTTLIKRIATDTMFPFFVIAPQCPQRTYWDREKPSENIKQLIEELASSYNIDKNITNDKESTLMLYTKYSEEIKKQKKALVVLYCGLLFWYRLRYFSNCLWMIKPTNIYFK
jgi:hypothetical protein